MNRRDLRNFITKRSSIWTLSLCMTGAIVLGSIAAVDSARRSGENQVETELGDMVYLDEQPAADDEELFYTIEEGELYDEEAEEGIAANADGVTDNTDADSENTAENANETAADDSYTGSPDGNTYDNSAEANTNGTAVDAAANADSAREAASMEIISEQTLLEAGVSFGNEQSLMWPSAGTILVDYSMDGSVYFPTLNQYKYNPALIIGSEVGNQVLASAKGIVESIGVENETGTTLVLNIGNGYKLTYGQLKELAVAQGDVVEAGTVIGYVSEPTKYYSTEGSNLYFKMTQGESAVDPVLYLE